MADMLKMSVREGKAGVEKYEEQETWQNCKYSESWLVRRGGGERERG